MADDFMLALERASRDEEMGEALAALRKVADALGVYRQSWTCQSVEELGDFLAAEIRRVRG